jgi:hypothetical protein
LLPRRRVQSSGRFHRWKLRNDHRWWRRSRR